MLRLKSTASKNDLESYKSPNKSILGMQRYYYSIHQGDKFEISQRIAHCIWQTSSVKCLFRRKKITGAQTVFTFCAFVVSLGRGL